MRVSLPDGRIIEAPDGATQRDVLALAGSAPPAAEPVQQMPQAAPEEAPGHLKGLALMLGQGLTLGWSDEIEGRLRQALGENYEQAVSDSRARIDAYRNANPGKALTAELAGSLILGAGALGRLAIAKSAALPAKIGRMAAVSGAEGAVGGAGAAKTVADIPERAATGAALATVTSGVAPFAVGVTRMVRGALPRGGGGSSAAQQVARNIVRDDTTTQAMANRLKMEPALTMAEAGGANVQQVAESIAKRPGIGPQLGRQTVIDRAVNQDPQLIKQAMNESFGATGSGTSVLRKIEADMKRLAKPLYRRAEKISIRKTPEIDEILSRPSGQDAIEAAQAAALEEGRTLAVTVGEDGVMRLKNSISFRDMQRIKRGYMQTAEKAWKNPDIKKDPRAIQKSLDNFKTAVLSQNKAWAEADKHWSEGKRLEEAFDFGLNLFKKGGTNTDEQLARLDPEAIRRYARHFTEAERKAAIAGMSHTLSEQVESIAAGGNIAAKTARTNILRAKVEALAGPRSDVLFKALDSAGRRSAFKARITGGSPTDPLRQTAEDTDSFLEAMANQGIVKGASQRAMRAITMPLGEQKRNEMAKILFMKGDDPGAKNALKLLLEAEEGVRRTQRGTARVGSSLGGGVSVEGTR